MSTTTPRREVLLPAEVATLFQVNPRTIDRWVKAGRIPSFKTLSGQRRFYADEVEPLAAKMMTSQWGATTNE